MSCGDRKNYETRLAFISTIFKRGGRAAWDAGASSVNDVSGAATSRMMGLVAERGAGSSSGTCKDARTKGGSALRDVVMEVLIFFDTYERA